MRYKVQHDGTYYRIWDIERKCYLIRGSSNSGWIQRNECQDEVDKLNAMVLRSEQTEYDADLMRLKSEAWDRLYKLAVDVPLSIDHWDIIEQHAAIQDELGTRP